MVKIPARITGTQNTLSHDTLKSAEPMLTKLRLAIFSEITDKEERTPELDEITKWIREKYKENPTTAKTLTALLLIKEDLIAPNSNLPTLEEAIRDIHTLEKFPLQEHFFVSSKTENESYGILFEREHLRDEGLVFSATIFEQTSLIEKVGRLEIRVAKKNPEPFISILTKEGYVTLSKNKAHTLPIAALTTQCLAYYRDYRYQIISVESIRKEKGKKPKKNPYLDNLIKEAYLDKILCTKITIPLEIVTPKDINHALRIHEEAIRSYFPYAAETEFLLYEKDGKLFMDDDYIPYMACHALSLKNITAVILGDFNQPLANIISTGHSELIPPISVSRGDSPPKRLISNNQELLNNRIQSLKEKPAVTTKLNSNFIELCKLLNRVETREKDLHAFLKKNAIILDSHLARIHSEVPIGKYRADLVLQYNQSDKRIVLVELEPHNEEIFNKRNRIRYKVTHALQQVEDWILQIHSNAQNIPKWLQENYTAEGMIVIGRSDKLTDEQKKTLELKNSKSNIKIITYDDLLERLSRLIQAIETR